MTALLIGLGSTFRGDDAIGIEVAQRVAQRDPEGVTVVEVDDPATLLDVWADAEHVVVVDAMVSGRAPGTIVTLDVTNDPLPLADWTAAGSHGFGLAAAVELGRALGRLPQRLLVVGVEAASTTAGAEPSADVAAALEPALAATLAALKSGAA